MEKRIKQILSLVLISTFCVVAFSTPAIGKSQTSSKPSAYQARNTAEGFQIVVDLIAIRPVLFGITALGSACYVVTLPFTLIGQNATYAGKKMVVEPGKMTFAYPLGSY